jgi:predicted PurR-regulated permease PerM
MAPGKPKLVGRSEPGGLEPGGSKPDGSQPEALPTSPEQPDVGGKGIDSVLPPVPGPWMERYKLSYVALFLLTAGALYVFYVIFRPYFSSLFLALVLSIAFMPVHEWVTRHVHRPTLAALITTSAVMLVVMVPLLFIGSSLFSQAASLYAFISQRMGSTWSDHFAWATEAMERTAEHVGMPPQQLKSIITARVQEFGAWLVGMAGWAARGFMQQMGTAILTLLILFFFLRDREKYVHYVSGMLPLPPGRAQQLGTTLRDTVIGNLYGMVAVALIQGALTTIGWWMAGLPAPLFWGAIATLFSFVPLVGPSLIWIPGALVLAVQGRWVPAIALGIWGAVVVSSVDYIVRPRFAAGRVNANTLLVLLSLLGGLRAFGAIGIIAGPVVLSAVTALLSMMREEQQNVYR